MPELTFLPAQQSLTVDSTLTIREAAHRLGIDVHDRCGGFGACCNCIVAIVEGAANLNAKTQVEEAVLYLGPNERLSCQCRLFGPVTVQTV